MANSKIEEAARNWFIGIPQNGDGLYHLTYEQIIKTIMDFAEQFKAEQKQVFPLPSEWIDEFKKAWYRDNDVGVLSKTEIKDMWDKTERVCNMIYQYQRRAFEAKQQKQVPTDEEIKALAEKEYPIESEQWCIDNCFHCSYNVYVEAVLENRIGFIKCFKSALQFNNTSPDL